MGALGWMLSLGFLWRLCICWLTPVPSEDGVNYLWMAERFAEADFGQGLSDVFPPLLPLLTALPILGGLEPFRAAQMVLCVGGTLAIIPMVKATEILVPEEGACAGLLVAFAPLPVRFCGEVYTEPLFLLFGGMAVWAGLGRRWWRLGLWSGLAFWLRPESLILPVAFLLWETKAWRALVPCGALVFVLAIWRGLLGLGLGPVAKLDLVLERSVFEGGVQSSFVGFLENMLQIPWLCVEAYGPVALLAILGVYRRRNTGMSPLLWSFGMAVVVICLFLARRRFLLSWFIVVIPLAVAGYRALPGSMRKPLLGTIVVLGLVVGLRTTDPDRLAEKSVGEHLASLLQPGELITGDMTRVIYYAGQRPLVPRRFSVDELAEAALGPGVRYAVFGERRETTAGVLARLGAEYRPLDLPGGVASSAAERGIVVLRRN